MEGYTITLKDTFTGIHNIYTKDKKSKLIGRFAVRTNNCYVDCQTNRGFESEEEVIKFITERYEESLRIHNQRLNRYKIA